jgi:hypothetical protein
MVRRITTYCHRPNRCSSEARRGLRDPPVDCRASRSDPY